ncbi:hypothetical protein G7Y89_g13797 [Cudoniella acicularis]|uniref:AHC1-like C2H2 zinc-finger domain-containing protein n=1 Tax=Cudoniella acicularis TaxID=354080 RepID=A0A8H4R7V5_9HELO|nr:hypothetical protein G7Y89_g13797 [Cudoniella acicularis]
MANATRPVVEIMPGGLSKRKREDSEGAPDLGNGAIPTHDAKRRKPDVLDEVTPKIEESFKDQVAEKTDSVIPEVRITDAIESQFNLEILLKHNELRLINQELAKCQVALEQLRRCHLIPYPTSQGTSESMFNISNGTGPAISQKGNIPQWAPPYGVTDGPYSRHYSKWLLPDASFDGEHADTNRGLEGSRAGKTIPEGRATRNSFVESSTPTSKSRSQRGSAGQKLQALSNGYPLAKEKVGPCVLKRGDGQMVKLVCIDCHRENFSSTQGFINHCRIAHRRDFKSHEEAAIASGQPIEVDEVGGIVGEEKSPTVATGLVHPLIRSAPANPETYSALISRINASMDLYRQGKLPGVTSIPTSVPSTPVDKVHAKTSPNKDFIPSLDTPHLSNLMRNRGFGGNLTQIVGDAKKPIDFEELSSHDEDSDDGDAIEQRSLNGLNSSDSPITIMRVPARAAMSPAPLGRPGSSKGTDGKNSRMPGLSGISPRPSYATPAVNKTPVTIPQSRPSIHLSYSQRPEDVVTHHPDDDVDMEMRGPSLNDLSPNTVASNNAPSLVSDDGEYEEGDDAESVNSEVDDDSVAEIDFIEDDGVEKVVPRTVMRNRSGSGGDNSMRLRKEEKHVTFVSPVKEGGNDRRKK